MFAIFPFVLMCSAFQIAAPARILGVFFIPAFSHHLVFHAVSKELSLRGHNVTLLTFSPFKDPTLVNLTEIDFSLYLASTEFELADAITKTNSLAKNFLRVGALGEVLLEAAFKAAQDHIPDERFDLLMVEPYHPLPFAFANKYQAPIVAMAPMGFILQTHDAAGNPTHPVFQPDLLNNVMGKMTLAQKFESVFHCVFYRLIYHWYLVPNSDKIARRYFGPNAVSVDTITRNTSLFLTNTNPLTNIIRPNLPNVIEIGPLPLQQKSELPQDLQDFLESSPQGVIYVSFGSLVKSNRLSVELQNAILGSLAELPYNVLLKWDAPLDTIPENILIRSWFPQQDLLSHRHIKAFVTQGGLHSIEEAISAGVPLVSVPFFADQPLNTWRLTQNGIGLGIDPIGLTKKEFKRVIVEVAEGKKYKENAKELQALLHDQPMTGLEKAVWWIEYVIRNKGARRLRSPTADTTWWEYFLLDLLAVVLVGIITARYVLRFFWVSLRKISQVNPKHMKTS